MQAVRNKDSKIELLLRKELWSRGYRYRKNYGKLLGRPDIVLTKYKTAIFCDSEFWHGFDWENRKHEIKTNKEFWIEKIEGNIKRDKEVTNELRRQGWTVLRFWGQQIERNIDYCMEVIETAVEEAKRREKDSKEILGGKKSD